MIKEIWKFRPDALAIPMPRGSEILDIQLQDGQVTVWALCPPSATLVNRFLVPLPTGAEIEDSEFSGTHVATLQIGELVAHYFDCGEALL